MSDDDRTLSLNDQQFAIMEGRHLADMFLRTTRGVTRAKPCGWDVSDVVTAPTNTGL